MMGSSPKINGETVHKKGEDILGNHVLFNIWPSTNKKGKASLILCVIQNVPTLAVTGYSFASRVLSHAAFL